MKPKSRGRITLLANDNNVKPKNEPNYFDYPDDMKTMIASIRIAIRLGQTKTMQALDSQLLNITYSEYDNHEYNSDAYWEYAIRLTSAIIYHFAGTCQNGSKRRSNCSC